MLGSGREAVRIPEAAYCAIGDGAEVHHLLVERARAQNLFEAVILVGRFLFSGVRRGKYLTLFKAYECVTDSPTLELSVVRHCIAHPESTLTRPRTLAAANAIFGAPRIDFEKHAHLRKFYQHLGQLLIETDALLHDQLASNMHVCIKISHKPHVLVDWQAATS